MGFDFMGERYSCTQPRDARWLTGVTLSEITWCIIRSQCVTFGALVHKIIKRTIRRLTLRCPINA